MAWKPGQSGNPKGSPFSEAFKKLKADLLAFLPGATEQLFQRIREGDVQSLALYFKLTVPPLRPEAPPVEVKLKRGQSPADASETVVRLMLAGEISPTAACEVIDALQGQIRIADFEEVQIMLKEWRESRKAHR